MLGQVPLYPRNSQLLDLGKLERRIGANARAIEALQEVLAADEDSIRNAEASFHLGLALVAEQRDDEGKHYLEAALEHPAFRVSALRNLAILAEDQGDSRQALEYLRRLRWELPDELWPCLQFAEVARNVKDFAAALESLRWATLRHGSDPLPFVAFSVPRLTIYDEPPPSRETAASRGAVEPETGSVKANELPPSELSSTQIAPPWAATRRLQMARPRPSPPARLCSPTWI